MTIHTQLATCIQVAKAWLVKRGFAHLRIVGQVQQFVPTKDDIDALVALLDTQRRELLMTIVKDAKQRAYTIGLNEPLRTNYLYTFACDLEREATREPLIAQSHPATQGVQMAPQIKQLFAQATHRPNMNDVEIQQYLRAKEMLPQVLMHYGEVMIDIIDDVREAIEMDAAEMADKAGLGVGEWEALIDRTKMYKIWQRIIAVQKKLNAEARSE